MKDERRIVAYQLSLFGEPPRRGYGWRPTFYTWRICGCSVPPDETAVRQAFLLRADTLPNGLESCPRTRGRAVA